MKLQEVVEKYLYYIQYQKEEPVMPQTYASTSRRMKQILKAWHARDIESITKNNVMQLREDMIKRGNKMSTVYIVLCAVRSLLRFAEEELNLAVLNRLEVKLPHVKPTEVKYLTSKEIAQVLLQINPNNIFGLRLMAFLTVMLDTGMRVSECLRLQRNSIKETEVLIDGKLEILRYADIIGKGGLPRKVVFKDWSLQWVQRYLEQRKDNNPAMFVIHCLNQEGGEVTPMRYESVRKALDWLSDKSGIDVLSHMLRRSGSTKMSENGADPAEIQKWLGHTSLQYTMRYIGVSLIRLAKSHLKYNNFGVEAQFKAN